MAEELTPPEEREEGSATESARKLLERNGRILRLRLIGWTWVAIAADIGVSERTCRTAFAEMRDAGIVSMKAEDAEEAAWQLLENYRLSRVELFEVFEAAKGNHAARVGALKAYVDVLGKEADLRQAVGLLPRSLGEIAVRIDMRFVQQKILTVLRKHDDEISDDLIDELIDALKGGVETARSHAALTEG